MLRKLAVALLAPLLALTACSDDGDESQRVEAGDIDGAIAALRAAPDAAAEAGSGRMEMVVAFEMEGEQLELTSTGFFTGTRMQLEMDLGALLAAQAPGAEMPEGFDEPMVVIADGTTSYLRMPMLAALTGNSDWLSVTPEDLGLASEALGAGAFGPASNPAQMLETLRGISDELEEVGAEKVRGADTIHYRAVVDLEQAVAEIPEALRPQLEAQLGGLAGTLPMDVWLGTDGLVRRLSMDMTELLAQASAESGVSMEAGSLVMDFFDYGADVEVEIPDADETTPFTEVLGGLGR